MRRRPVRGLAAVLVVALAVAGCGGDDDEPSGSADGTTTTTTTAAPTTTTSPAAASGLAAGLLAVGDLPVTWTPLDAGGGGVVDEPIPAICGEGTIDLAAAEERAEATFKGSALGPFAFHALGRFGGDAGAAAAFATFVDTVERCAAASGQRITIEPLDLAALGDERHGLRLGLASPIGRIAFDVGLTRYGDVLSLLMVGGLSPDPALLGQAAAAVDAKR